MGNFEPRHLIILDQAAHLAADLVAEEFNLDLNNFRQWPVDVRHYPDLAAAEIVPGVLAQVLCYRREAILQSQKPDFYRVCLYDPDILSAADREKLPLLSLLAYILTHEFIHIARFIRFLELFSLAPDQRAKEEALVHSQTNLLLSGRNLPNLNQVMDLFQQKHLPLDKLDPLRPDKFPDG